VETLLVVVGEDERHPLAGLLDLLGLHMDAYESERYPIKPAHSSGAASRSW
jgi:hypothetical protein